MTTRLALRSSIVGALLLLPTAGVAAAQGLLGTPILCNGGVCEGTDGKDTIVASNNAEEVVAGAGDDDIELDVVFLGGSNDVAYGGEGRDCIDGGGGDDLMVGGPGDDNRSCEFSFFVNLRAAMTGGPGNDVIEGGPGNDTLDGIFDDDTLRGGPGDDIVEDPYGFDADTVLGGPGNDVVRAPDADGDDVIDGGPGRDECLGDAGDTFLNCEVGNTRTGPTGDTTAPEVTVTGVPTSSCVRRAFTVDLTARDSGGLAVVEARRDATVLGGRPVSDATDTSFPVRVPVAGLRAGRHRIAVTARDEAGNTSTVQRSFRRCAARSAAKR